MGLVVSLIGVLGFFLIAPSSGGNKNDANYEDDHPINVNINRMMHNMDSIFSQDRALITREDSFEVYELSLKIKEAYEHQYNSGDIQIDTIWEKDGFCTKYIDYFSGYCE